MAQRGDFNWAHLLIREAEAIARPYRNAALKHLINNANGWIYYSRGEYQKALRAHLNTSFSPFKSSARDRASIAMAFLHGARCALKLGSLGQARRLLSRAQPLVLKYPHPALRGYLKLLRGDLKREQGTRAGYREARRYYSAAEKIFLSHPTVNAWWMGQVHLCRGTLYLKERNIARALQEADLSMELGKRSDALELQEESLLLKSFLLLEEGAPRLDLYEMLLRSMSLVKNPVVMFLLLANLYIHSWDLEEHIELTDLHLKQIHGLSEVIPEETYSRLYGTYINDRVLVRFLSRMGMEIKGKGSPEAGSER
jgi:hypothetical protein